MGSSAIERLSDADLWEQLVASGVPKDQATEQVMQRGAAARLASETQQRTPYTGKPQVGNLKGGAVAAGQGATAGWLDELAGLVNGLGGTVAGMPQVDPTRYAKGRDAVREIDASYAQEHPKTHLAEELVGGIPSAIAAPGGPIAGAAGYGAASGAGNSNGDLLDRAVGAGVGGTIGAGLGAMISSVAPTTKEIAGKVASRVGPPLRAAGRALMRDPSEGIGATPKTPLSLEQLSQRAYLDALSEEIPTLKPMGPHPLKLDVAPETPSPAEGRAVGLLLKRLGSDKRDVGNLIADAESRPVDEPVSLMELGGHNQNVRGLARGARSVPSKAKTEIPEKLYARAEQEPILVRNKLESLAGTNATDPALLTKALEAGKRSRANVKYGEAYADEPIHDAGALAIFHDEAAPSIYRIAKRQASRDGVDLPSLDEIRNGNADMPVQGFDYFKRATDDYIGARKSRGKMGRNEARQLRGMLDDALEKVDAQRPKFAEARQQFAEDSQLGNMVELGQNALNMDDREVARQVTGMTENERRVFAKSWLDAAVKKIRETGDSQDVYQRLFGNQLKRDTFKALLGDKYAQLEQAFSRGTERMASKRMVLGGSNTVDKASEALDLETGGIPDAALQLISGRPRAAVRSLGQSVLVNRLRGITGETADALSPMLTAGSEGGPAARESLLGTLKRLRQAEIEQAARRTTQRSTGKITKPLAGAASQRRQ